MKKGIFIQARMSSKRFPNKMLKNLGDISLIQYVYNNCTNSKQADIIVVITSVERSDDALANHCRDNNILVYRGSLDNVLDRYINAAKHFECELIGRVCGDSPFVDIDNLDNMFVTAYYQNMEYVRFEQAVPGLLSEVVHISALESIKKMTSKKDDLEHVTKFILSHKDKFIVDIKKCPRKCGFSYTVDHKEDLDLCNDFIGNGEVVG